MSYESQRAAKEQAATEELIRMRQPMPRKSPEDYDRGFLHGLKAYAYMKDGVYYVGTTGRSLKEAAEKYKDTWNYTP